MAAAGKGRLEDAAALLTAGADPSLKSSDGSTAQDWAARFGHDDLAEFLGTHMQVTLMGASFLTQIPPTEASSNASQKFRFSRVYSPASSSL